MAHVGKELTLGLVGCPGMYGQLIRTVNRVLEQFIGLGLFLLRQLTLGDVGINAPIADNFACIIQNRDSAGRHAYRSSFLGENPIFHILDRTFSFTVFNKKSADFLLLVQGHEIKRGFADNFLSGIAQEIFYFFRTIGKYTINICFPYPVGHALCNIFKTGLRVF